ncbi:MAG: hypothetical protein ABL866_02330 [Devosia sp.]
MSRLRRLLGIAASHGKIGFAYLVDGELMDWGLSVRASKSFEEAFKRVTAWTIYYRPDIVVTERVEQQSRKGAHTRTLIRAAESAANNADADYVEMILPAHGPNKYAAAAALAAEFPQIEPWLPRKRRAWEPEPRNIIYFEALALVWAYWKSAPALGENQTEAQA